MTRTELKNGYVKLTSENGVKDTRTEAVYSEVVVKEKNERFFVEVEVA